MYYFTFPKYKLWFGFAFMSWEYKHVVRLFKNVVGFRWGLKANLFDLLKSFHVEEVWAYYLLLIWSKYSVFGLFFLLWGVLEGRDFIGICCIWIEFLIITLFASRRCLKNAIRLDCRFSVHNFFSFIIMILFRCQYNGLDIVLFLWYENKLRRRWWIFGTNTFLLLSYFIYLTFLKMLLQPLLA